MLAGTVMVKNLIGLQPSPYTPIPIPPYVEGVIDNKLGHILPFGIGLTAQPTGRVSKKKGKAGASR